MPTPLGKSLSTRRTMSLLSGGISPFIQALLTDLYQLTMCYGYWKAKKHEDLAVFDLFFRKNPFKGEYTIFCGLDECLKFLENFRFTTSDIAYLKTVFPVNTEEAFFEYLASLDASCITVRAIPEGTVVFPKIPLLVLEGPLAVCQLVETTLLNLVNYASLVGTNAARFRHAAGDNISLLEFGLRRAQGPNGGLCASKYCYIGGFDGTSNLLAGKLYHIPVKGTHAHAFVNSFSTAEDLTVRMLKLRESEEEKDLYALALHYKTGVCALASGVMEEEVNEGELAAFCAYALAFPHAFLALIDTYDVLRSGVINFCSVALALWECGYKAVGVRIDSGDLAYLSKETRRMLKNVAEYYKLEWLGQSIIVASNDINEDTIYSLNDQKHEINSFGVGTHLVTCQKQPALGCVYKLVSVKNKPRIKLSQDVEKITLPGKKKAYRLYSKHGHAINDLLLLENEPAPEPGKSILCRHPFQENKRAYVTPNKVMELHQLYWADGKVQLPLPELEGIRANVRTSLSSIREDSRRNLNPTPYKVSLSEKLYDFVHSLWLTHAPIGQLE